MTIHPNTESQDGENSSAGFSTAARLSDPDGFYQALIAMHHGLSEAQSQQVNARLILLLSNQIGDCSVLRAAMQLARAGVAS